MCLLQGLACGVPSNCGPPERAWYRHLGEQEENVGDPISICFLSFIKCCLMFKYLTMNIKEQHIQPLFISYKCAYTGDKHSKLFY